MPHIDFGRLLILLSNFCCRTLETDDVIKFEGLALAIEIGTQQTRLIGTGQSHRRAKLHPPLSWRVKERWTMGHHGGNGCSAATAAATAAVTVVEQRRSPIPEKRKNCCSIRSSLKHRMLLP